MKKTLVSIALLAAACSTGPAGRPAGSMLLGSDQQGVPADVPPLPGIYDMKMCVVTADPQTRMATFMPPNAENPNASVAFAFNDLSGFELAGEDKVFKPAQAKIEKDTVLVTSAEVPETVAVRYAWRNAPVAGLFNKEGLPAVPFRSDTW